MRLTVTDLPHCGAVVTRTQDERAARLLARLAAELTRRQDLLAADGFAGISEQRAAAPPGDRLPHVLVLLDRWEGFTTTLGEAGGGALTDVITRILAEGASAGIHLVMTGDRSLLAGRIAAMALGGPGVVVIDDADLLADCEAGAVLSKIITRSAGRPLALILAGDPDTLASGSGGWPADARRARRGCLTAPQTLPEGELIGVRLAHGCTGHPPRPGRALLHTGDGTLTTIAAPAG